MDRSIPARVVLALAVVLAGCSGVFGGSESTPTVTPVAVPTDEPTATPAREFAPGLDGTGVTDPLALGAAHASALDQADYTVRRSVMVRYANGAIATHRTTEAEFAASSSRYSIVEAGSDTSSVGSLGRLATWSDGERLLMARTANGTTSYRVIDVPDRGSGSVGGWLPDNLVGSERIASVFGAVATRVVGETTRNGTTYYRLRGAGPTDDADLGGRWGEPRNATLRAIVDSRGIVHEYRLRYEGTVNGTPVTVVRRVGYTDIGATIVERPPWYDAALRNATVAASNVTGTTNPSVAAATTTATANATPTAAVDTTATATATTATAAANATTTAAVDTTSPATPRTVPATAATTP